MSIDWSEDTAVQASPSPCISPAGKHIPLPHSIEGNNMSRPSHQSASGLGTSVLNYNNN